MRIVIGNLPQDASEQGIREALGQFAPVDKITLVKDSAPPTAVIEIELAKPQAEALANRINGRLYKGRALSAWVPMTGWK